MNVQHERNLHLRARLKGEKLLTDAVTAQLEVPWRTNGILAQIVFFLLTCLALGAFYGLMHMFEWPHGIITGAVAIILAEYLIGARRWMHTGIEDALWIGGVIALISELPSSGSPEAMLVIAAAIGAAGFRVRNPLFGAAAAIFVMWYAERRFDLGVVVALSLALIACIALLRTWRRATTEWLWIALALAMPVAGRFTASVPWRTTTIALYAIYAIIAMLLAVRWRHHALFLTGMIAGAIAATDLAEQITRPAEAKFGLAGTLLLLIAFALTRTLRGRTLGFVLTPTQLTPFDETLQTAATLTLQPTYNAPPAAEPQVAAGGGGFGGAGASGDY
jgi:hypothetical protein